MHLEQESAVQSYIDALLFDERSITDTVTVEPVTNTLSQSRLADSEHAKMPVTQLPSAVSSRVIKSKAFVRHLELAQQRVHSPKDSIVNRAVNKAPVWAGDTVCCLTVKTGNLKLAIPCQFIDSVKPLGTLMEGHIDTSHAGVRKEDASILIESCGEARFSAVSSGEVVLVDTARLVMPERYSLEMRANYRHVIQLKGTGWALPVDAVGGEIEYVSTKVRWRSAHTRRAWLAGTIIEDMCAILDIDAIHRIVLADSVLGSSGCVPN